jgi:hypothetical protein
MSGKLRFSEVRSLFQNNRRALSDAEGGTPALFCHPE